MNKTEQRRTSWHKPSTFYHFLKVHILKATFSKVAFLFCQNYPWFIYVPTQKTKYGMM